VSEKSVDFQSFRSPGYILAASSFCAEMYLFSNYPK